MNTSANIPYNFAIEIIALSVDCEIPISKIVKMLLVRILPRIRSSAIENCLTDYQRFKHIDWKLVHFCPDFRLINSIAHSRFKYRISTSKLISIAFLLFWDDVVAECYNCSSKQERIELWDEILFSYEIYILQYHQFTIHFIEKLNIKHTYSIKPGKLE